MNFIDILIILIFAYGIYFGYQNSFFSILKNIIVLFISSLVSGLLSDVLFGLLYKSFIFFNFFGKAQGLKSINIIFWKLLLYITLLISLLFIFSNVLRKTKIEEKILDSEMTAGIISRVVGAILSIALTDLVLFNTILLLLSPNFNFKLLNNSNFGDMIMKNTPVVSKYNSILYQNEKYIIDRINESDNNKTEFENVNNDIIYNMIDTNLVTEDIINYYNDENKLLGSKTIKKKKKDNNKEEYDDYEDDNESYDDDSTEYYDESDEEYYDDYEEEYFDDYEEESFDDYEEESFEYYEEE